MVNEKQFEQNNTSMIVCISIFFAVVVMMVLHHLTVLPWNYVVYLGGSAAFILCFLSSRLWRRFLPDLEAAHVQILGIAVALGLTIFLLLILYYEPLLQPYAFADGFLWHKIPFVLLIILIMTIGVGGFWLICRPTRPIISAVYVGLTIIGAAMAFASVYCINLFNGDYTHGDAFMHAIYVFLDGAPFDRNVKQIYGFYAILYAIPVRFFSLFTDTWTAMVICVGLVAALTVFAYAGTIYYLLHNPWLKGIALFAGLISFVAKRSYNYWQLWPHRVLFPMLVIYSLCVKSRKKHAFAGLLPWLLCFLGIINNFETGIICLIVVCGYHVFKQLQESSELSLSWYLRLLGYALKAIGTVLAAYLFINVVNLLMGGPFIGPGSFLFPIVGGADFGGYLYMELPKMPTSWILYFFALLTGICVPLRTTRLLGGQSKNEDRTAIVFASSLMGMGVGYYYYNRAAYYNLDICILSFTLVIACLADLASNTNMKAVKQIHNYIGIVSVGLLSVMCIGTLVQFPYRLSERYTRGDFSYTDLEEGKQWIKEYLPVDTFFYGKGLEMLCGYTGVTLNCYCTNTGDIIRNEQLLDYVYSEYPKHDTLVLDVIADYYMNVFGDYTYLGNYKLYQVWSRDPEIISRYSQSAYGTDIDDMTLDQELDPSAATFNPELEREVIKAWIVAYGFEPTEEELNLACNSFEQADGKYIYDLVCEHLDIESLDPANYIQSLFNAFESDPGENSRKWLLKERYVNGELSAWDCMRNVMHSKRTFARME